MPSPLSANTWPEYHCPCSGCKPTIASPTCIPAFRRNKVCNGEERNAAIRCPVNNKFINVSHNANDSNEIEAAAVVFAVVVVVVVALILLLLLSMLLFPLLLILMVALFCSNNKIKSSVSLFYIGSGMFIAGGLANTIELYLFGWATDFIGITKNSFIYKLPLIGGREGIANIADFSLWIGQIFFVLGIFFIKSKKSN